MSRPTIMSGLEAASTGHYLATQAAMEMLAQGGNAVDAGVAAGLALGIVETSHVSIGGVAPIIVKMADTRVPVTIAGLGTWPRRADCAALRQRFGDAVPRGVLRTVMPAAPAAWIEALRRFGTMTFADVAAPAIRLARDGFPVTTLFHDTILAGMQALAGWPSSAALLLPGGRPPAVGTLFANTDAANVLQHMADEERAGPGPTRETGLMQARNAFYKGDIAHKMAAFIQAEGGLLDRDDLAAYEVEVGEAVAARFGDVDVFGCGPWCQGPMLLQMLTILQQVGLDGLKQNSVPYLHLLAEVIRLAARDRETYFGDPNFVAVPLQRLLSTEHARRLAAMISRDAAMPGFGPASVARTEGVELDTSFVSVIDRFGNAFAATPSDGCTGTPIVPGLGFIVSSRGGQSWTDPAHPSGLAPGKRPRLTPNPAIAVRDGGFVMPFGTPGHDAQGQVMLQVFLNLIYFGMAPQDAVSAPRIISLDFPSSVMPHEIRPGLMFVEAELGAETLGGLRALGHDARFWPQEGPDYAQNLSSACLVHKDFATGVISAAADPRRPAYAIGR